MTTSQAGTAIANRADIQADRPPLLRTMLAFAAVLFSGLFAGFLTTVLVFEASLRGYGAAVYTQVRLIELEHLDDLATALLVPAILAATALTLADIRRRRQRALARADRHAAASGHPGDQRVDQRADQHCPTELVGPIPAGRLVGCARPLATGPRRADHHRRTGLRAADGPSCAHAVAERSRTVAPYSQPPRRLIHDCTTRFHV